MEALLSGWLWREDFWLPPGTRWRDLRAREHLPLPGDLLYTLPLALAFMALRYVFERLVGVPLSKRLGVRDKVRVGAPPIPQLEDFYLQRSRQPSQGEVVSLGKQCGLSQRKIQTWFRRRRNQDRPSNTRKFCEASWRFVFYLVAFSAGLASLIHVSLMVCVCVWVCVCVCVGVCVCVWVYSPTHTCRSPVLQTSWFWDHTEFWRGYPKQALEPAHRWYYLLEMGFYVSLLLSVSADVKRKDFKEQVIHHITTIFLIGFSYCTNFVRVGTFVMMVHDSSDFLLESAKMFHYAGWRRTCDSLFVVFAAVFLVTRLLVLPVRWSATSAATRRARRKRSPRKRGRSAAGSTERAPSTPN
ncbi:unnamed protein product [Tetraodon nigroviridis]|uniref:(spotted green pufferfish) hypothetical protein n=1 Tax=Tetraodon nigroviridis TaxID=99883 RepID=Q4RU99_TETNG|nr:unnamed protein product [Tetraodon nigroviridis]